ncbi:glutamate-1-semialdehyde-2,1-aminomutase [Virgibacillus dokdonensis]|uniref:Glutamate-1-semialdehyde 2,1-aminomutase n=1 Tax=Virgibacillus dokdonensis TaxID=302167 RepID=A0A3E0WGL2_9BACI|nr:glutamate-1-semialdehyde 2,1-aminomutase [Virgibacillus dokdonensis]RFA32024.1 glutamate-1-semialdehyde-2,1-aminomutase [Virgibacillus dokdonensis]
MNTKRVDSYSEALFQQAKNVIPGGVNSPVRAFSLVGSSPVFIKKGQGSHVVDVDGKKYIDYICSWGPLILGHAHPAVEKEIQKAVCNGSSFGLSTEIEVKMAKLICEIVPSIEMVRMVNSGTEAVMSALRLARGYTKRQKIIKFQGGYHGHADALLIKAGSGVATLGLPDSPGISKTIAADTITLPYNCMESIRHTFEQFGEQIAAVIVEPVAGNMGVVPPNTGFLQGLRAITEQYGSLLIFDEVMTGFRVNYHGAQSMYGVHPDITCLGKIIGGGLPVGAYGGKHEVMEQIAPAGPIYQAGTLSGNPLAMSAGYKTLQLLEKIEIYDELERKAARLEEGFKQNAEMTNVALKINRVGSMLSAFFTEQDVVDYETAKSSDMQVFKKYYMSMLDLGILTAPTPYEVMFLSAAHSDEDIEETIKAHYQALSNVKNVEGVCNKIN